MSEFRLINKTPISRLIDFTVAWPKWCIYLVIWTLPLQAFVVVVEEALGDAVGYFRSFLKYYREEWEVICEDYRSGLEDTLAAGRAGVPGELVL